ncbi:hypothetical protein IE4771_CH02880 [Rhizobium etli bv. mimosae str. IE4771]|uniref:Uncharacterized protein n=1 Tax=Rhizobium etli bv. mimosae str. IE4771 TaxID=1432050 RepID=A0A060I8Q1_RHIET|nr:hypothetical protein IE4771_CH02880 [Rhizobium sp. IE4771]
MVLSPLAVTKKWSKEHFVPFWGREASNIRDFRLQPARIGAQICGAAGGRCQRTAAWRAERLTWVGLFAHDFVMGSRSPHEAPC